MKLACESIDRVLTTEIRLPFLTRGIIPAEYEAARAKIGGPISYAMASAILKCLEEGKNRVAVFTGVYHPENFPNGESDGPLGAAVVGNAIEKLGGDVTYCLEKETIPGTVHMLNYLEAGTKVIALDRENAENNTKLADQFDIAIYTEKLGPSKLGVTHYATGPSRGGYDSDISGFVNKFNADGKLSLGFGDVGNEIGAGFIYDEARKIVPLGTHCTCGKDDGIITCLASTYYFPVSVSNIGCYGLTAALGCLTKREDILHTAEKERALIKIGVEEVMLDGGYGINHEYIDGIPADTVCAVVEVLRCLAVICHDNSNRGF
ncbi:MAG: DUF4392 domain-containing protein [Firmicutes bacterium]|nr:DUF4392 domain-containing protein [Bacillota bacterium]HCX43949.1 hypothetical protein [Oscillibacter sp.]